MAPEDKELLNEAEEVLSEIKNVTANLISFHDDDLHLCPECLGKLREMVDTAKELTGCVETLGEHFEDSDDPEIDETMSGLFGHALILEGALLCTVPHIERMHLEFWNEELEED